MSDVMPISSTSALHMSFLPSLQHLNHIFLSSRSLLTPTIYVTMVIAQTLGMNQIWTLGLNRATQMMMMTTTMIKTTS